MRTLLVILVLGEDFCQTVLRIDATDFSDGPSCEMRHILLYGIINLL